MTLDVAVVGAGPVGLTLAALLERRGLACQVLEARDAPTDLPRAVHLDDEAQLILEEAGVAGDVAFRPLDGMALVDARLRPLFAFRRDRQPLGRPASVLMHQPDLEQALRGRAAHLIRTGARVTGLRAAGDAVELSVAGGAPVTARWVVGCDGAQSTLRGLAGIGLDDLGFRQRWLVVDLRVAEPVRHPAEVLQICDPARPATSVPVGAGRHRFELRAHAWESADELAGRAEGLVDGWARELGVAVTGLERAAVYEFRGRLARTFQRGRVLLAGDAAHEMPPFLGQGLCTGLRDAANLAWKIACVQEGRAHPRLLGTYGAERRPHARVAIRWTAAIGAVVSDRRRVRAASRDRLLRAAAATGALARLSTLRAPALPGGPLVERDGRPRSARLVDEGGADGRFGIVGVGVDPLAGLPAGVVRWFEGLGAVFLRTEASDRRRTALVVVRPDRIVLGRYRPLPGRPSPLADLAVRLSHAGLRARS